MSYLRHLILLVLSFSLIQGSFAVEQSCTPVMSYATYLKSKEDCDAP